MTQKTETTATATARDIPRGYWEAADGSLVPDSKVRPIDKARDKVVRQLIEAAGDMNRGLAEFKRQAMQEVAEFIDASAAEYGTTIRGAAGKGNVTLTSFDGRFRVERKINELIAFDERLQVAKAGLDACVMRWSKGANHNIQALVQSSFKPNRAGQVSVAAILKLRQLKIVDPEWQQAMAALDDSMHATGSVSYLRFYRREDATGKYLPISLDLATL